MSKRIFWMLPDAQSARRCLDDLLLARVECKRARFLAREDIELGDLPKAGTLLTTDVAHAAQMGVALGLVVGIAMGFVWAFVLGEGEPMWGLVGALGIVGAGFGAWASSLVGAGAPNSRLARFAEGIEAGRILMVVDAPRSRVEEIEELLARRHPEARFEGLDPMVPAFP